MRQLLRIERAAPRREGPPADADANFARRLAHGALRAASVLNGTADKFSIATPVRSAISAATFWRWQWFGSRS
ncbi:MAG: hypothetical protein R3D62_05795 [Xanthobacteraceae bacterium]